MQYKDTEIMGINQVSYSVGDLVQVKDVIYNKWVEGMVCEFSFGEDSEKEYPLVGVRVPTKVEVYYFDVVKDGNIRKIRM